VYPKKVRTKALISKVKAVVLKENPPTHRYMANKFGTSIQTINKIIHKDLALKKYKKYKVHRLTNKHRIERRRNCRLLYEKYLAREKWKNVVTIDKAWIYLSDSNKRAIFYSKNRYPDQKSWCLE